MLSFKRPILVFSGVVLEFFPGLFLESCIQLLLLFLGMLETCRWSK